MSDPASSPKPGGPLSALGVRPSGRINERQARVAGEILARIAREIQRGFREIRLDAFAGEPLLHMTGGKLAYNIEVEVRDADDDKARSKTSSVQIDLDLGVVSPPADEAFALLSGAIVPAEAARPRIEAFLQEKGYVLGHPPILGVEPGKFWVKAPDSPHLMVQFDSDGNGSLTVLDSLDALTRETSGFFAFLRDQLARIYGG